MCENCERMKEQAWAEIRDLLNFNRKVNGPLSESIKARLEDAKRDGALPEDEGEAMRTVESIRAQMISERCVLIARACENTEFHMMPASVIAGIWAGDLMRQEAVAQFLGNAAGGLLGLLFGGFPQPDEATDDD